MNTQPTQQHPQPTPAPTPRTALDELKEHLAALDLYSGLLPELVAEAQVLLAAKDAEIAKATSLLRLYFDNMNTYDKWYRELVEVVYEGGCDGVNERPDPRTVIKNIRAECDEWKARTEKAEAERDALRTLWTEARVVVAQCRDANCLVSYGKAQCDAVAAANAWLDKMPATMRRTIDDASNTEWQLQRVTAERDQLRAEVDQYKQDFRDQEKRIQAACRELAEVTGDRNIKRQLLEKLRAALAAAQQDTERLDWLDEHAYASGNVADGKPYQYGFLAPRSDIAAGRWIRAAIDAAREGNANKAQP